jgi:anti-sigma factor RsiW
MNTVRCPLQSDGDEGALLLSYMDRRLDAASTQAMDRHVAGCADCARVLDAQRMVWNALDQWEPVAVRADFDELVMARVEAEQLRGAQPWWQRLSGYFAAGPAWVRPAMPIAAAACVAVVGVAVWRGPAAVERQTAPSMDSAEVQQVEEALTDLEMLRQLGVAVDGSALPSAGLTKSL